MASSDPAEDRYCDDLALDALVWCATCQHTHISRIPVTTYACAGRDPHTSGCGFGCWERSLAERHATGYPDHLVYAIQHQIVPDPDPAPTWDPGEDGPTLPTGWTMIIAGSAAPGAPDTVLAGWTTDGRFHQYTDTETITRSLVSYLQDGIHV